MATQEKGKIKEYRRWLRWIEDLPMPLMMVFNNLKKKRNNTELSRRRLVAGVFIRIVTCWRRESWRLRE